LDFIAFLQALGIAVYCGLIGTVIIKGENWFGPQPGVLGPTLFLLLFSVSAVICILIFLAYPFIIFWEHKQTQTALHLVIRSTAWLAAFVIMGFSVIFALH
jgi:hypothetical protein